MDYFFCLRFCRYNGFCILLDLDQCLESRLSLFVHFSCLLGRKERLKQFLYKCVTLRGLRRLVYFRREDDEVRVPRSQIRRFLKGL